MVGAPDGDVGAATSTDEVAENTAWCFAARSAGELVESRALQGIWGETFEHGACKASSAADGDDFLSSLIEWEVEVPTR